MKKLLGLALALFCACGAIAQDVDYNDMPQATMFYPGANPEAPVELKPTTKAYIYFKSGSIITGCKANLRQNDAVLGSIVYNPMSNRYVCMMDPADEQNVALNELIEGDFDIEFFYLSYMSGDQEVTYDNPLEPFAQVTYHRAGEPNVVVSETGLADMLIKSYYPVDGIDGVKTYTFSKPLVPDGIKCYLAYAGSDIPYTRNQACSLSDDGLTITVDLRGKCNNVDALAPGVIFVDPLGNPCDPPTTISLVVSGLKSVDGTNVQTVSTNLEGDRSVTVTGEVYQAYNYLDLTFPNPVITKVEFYDSSVPNATYGEINDVTDMMKVSVDNAEYITSADIKMTNGFVESVIADADCNKTADGYLAAIPQEFANLGSNGLVVSLVNVQFVTDDGSDHTIAPYTFESKTKEVLSIAQMLQLADGTTLVLNAIEGLVVTLSVEAGYTFMEDETAGVMVVTEDYTQILTEGTKLIGKIAGTYLGKGIFMIDPANSYYTEVPADVREGMAVDNVLLLTSGNCDNRLVTLVFGGEMTASYDSLWGYLMIDGTIPVVTDFIEGYEVPDGPVKRITGVYSPDLSEFPMVLVRTADDIVFDQMDSINDIPNNADADQPMYNLKGIRINPASSQHGIYVIPGKAIIKK